MAGPRPHTIVWDLDDTMIDFMTPALKVVNDTLGKQLDRSLLSQGHWLHHHLTEEELSRVLPKIFNVRFYQNLAPHPAFKWLRQNKHWMELREHYNFQVVTAREAALSNLARHITSTWLHEWQIDVQGVTISSPSECKVPYMPASTKVVVDDSIKVCQAAYDAGHTVFMVDQPWNQKLRAEDGKRWFRASQSGLLHYMHEVLTRKAPQTREG